MKPRVDSVTPPLSGSFPLSSINLSRFWLLSCASCGKGDIKPYTQHKPGVLSPLTETPAHVLNWSNSMACRNWSLGVSFSSAPSLASRSCRVVRCVHPWDTEHYESFLQRTATERVYGEVEFDTFSSPNCVV